MISKIRMTLKTPVGNETHAVRGEPLPELRREQKGELRGATTATRLFQVRPRRSGVTKDFDGVGGSQGHLRCPRLLDGAHDRLQIKDARRRTQLRAPEGVTRLPGERLADERRGRTDIAEAAKARDANSLDSKSRQDLRHHIAQERQLMEVL